jgi:hypothetical protein
MTDQVTNNDLANKTQEVIDLLESKGWGAGEYILHEQVPRAVRFRWNSNDDSVWPIFDTEMVTTKNVIGYCTVGAAAYTNGVDLPDKLGMFWAEVFGEYLVTYKGLSKFPGFYRETVIKWNDEVAGRMPSSVGKAYVIDTLRDFMHYLKGLDDNEQQRTSQPLTRDYRPF